MFSLNLMLPTLLGAFGVLVVLMYGAFYKDAKGSAVLSGLVLATMAAPLVLMPASGATFITAAGPLFSASPFTLLASLIVLALGVLVVPLGSNLQGTLHKPEFYVLLLLSVVGMLVLIGAHDMLTLYMGLELMSFALYILVAFARDDAASSEAGLKYFVLGSLASGLLLYGISLIYAATGTVNFSGLAQVLVNHTANPLLLSGLVLVAVALLFKLSVVPLHMWTPDVYEGAPTVSTALMAALPKVAAMVVLVRLLNGPFASLTEHWQLVLAWLAGLTMLVGSSLAIVQTSLKRLLAYSTIANVGFVLLGAVAANVQGHASILFYLAVYGVGTLGLFAALMVLNASKISHLKGLGKTHPRMALGLMVLLFSLAGVPPFAGFMAKFSAFSAALNAGFGVLVLVAGAASVVASFYSLWLIKTMYFDAPESPKPRALSTEDGPKIVLGISVMASIMLGLYPTLLMPLCLAAATAIF
jgi:NADH-quinone oxidoreductase subunit N